MSSKTITLACLLLACGGAGPPSTPVQSMAVSGAGVASDGTRVQLTFQLLDAAYAPTVVAGTATVEIRERPEEAGATSGRVVCSAVQTFAPDAFRESEGWAASFDAALTPPCPPAPPGPDVVREVHAFFSAEPSSDDGGWLEAPPALRGQYTRDEARTEVQARAARAAAALAATEGSAGRERIDAYARTLGALVPVVAAGRDAPTSCADVPSPEAAPLIEEQDLAVIQTAFGGPPAEPPVRARATQDGLRHVIAVLDGVETDGARIGAIAGGLHPERPLLWVRTRATWTDPEIVEGEHGAPDRFVPGRFEATLLLVDRSAVRVVCGARIEAQSDDSVSAYASVEDARAALGEQLRIGLENAAWEATRAARQALTGDRVPFDIPPAE